MFRRLLRRRAAVLLTGTLVPLCLAYGGCQLLGWYPSMSTTMIHYQCEDGTVFKTAVTPDTAILRMGDREYTLSRVRSGSGARYEGDGTLFWEKGGQAILELGGRRHLNCAAVNNQAS